MHCNRSILLLALFREEMRSIPNQLYHDIQCTFIDTIYCIAKLQGSSPESSFYTDINGTDPAQCFFGNCMGIAELHIGIKILIHWSTGLDLLLHVMEFCRSIQTEHLLLEVTAIYSNTVVWVLRLLEILCIVLYCIFLF